MIFPLDADLRFFRIKTFPLNLIINFYNFLLKFYLRNFSGMPCEVLLLNITLKIGLGVKHVYLWFEAIYTWNFCAAILHLNLRNYEAVISGYCIILISILLSNFIKHLIEKIYSKCFHLIFCHKNTFPNDILKIWVHVLHEGAAYVKKRYLLYWDFIILYVLASFIIMCSIAIIAL